MQLKQESVQGAATPSTSRNTSSIKTKETTMSNTNRANMREQALPSYLTTQQTSVATGKPNEFAPVVVADTQYLTFEEREKRSGVGTYKYPRFDMESIMRLSSSKQVAVVTDELRLAHAVCGRDFASNVFASQLEWALRTSSRDALNFIAYRAYTGHDVRDDVIRLANLIEVAFNDQEDLVSVVRLVGDCDVSIHGFHTHFKEGDLPEVDLGRAELTDEELSAEELMEVYAQRELQTRKESWSSVLGSDNAGSGIDPRISKEEWIAELTARSPQDWEEQAGYAAWAKAKKLVDLFVRDPNFKVAREMLGDFKAKPLSLYMRARRRSWDLQASRLSSQGRIEYIESQQNQNDNGVDHLGESNTSSLTTASMLNAKSDDEIGELKTRISDIKQAKLGLDTLCDLFKPLFDVARIDGELLEFNFYECYLTFDPYQEAITQVKLMLERSGKRFTREVKQQAIAMVKRELHGSELEELDGGLFHLFWKKELPEADMLERIRRVRLLRYKHDLRTGGFDTKDVEALKKSFAMRNKKKFVLDDVVDSFDV